MKQDSALRTFCRRMEILNFLKESRQLRSVTDIVEHLKDLDLLDIIAAETHSAQSYDRKIQRDLKFLYSNTSADEDDKDCGDNSADDETPENYNEFGLYFEPGDRHSFLWGIDHGVDTDFSWATMPDHMALTLALAEKHRATIMPSRYHQLLNRHYQSARQKLSNASKKYQPKQLDNLLNSVIIDQRGLRLEAANVDEQILDTIYEALCLRRRLQIRYQGKTVDIHPHGVVIARPKMYLLAMKNDDSNIDQMRSYLIHRIEEISMLKLSANILPGFELQTYVNEGGMEMQIENDNSYYQLSIELKPGKNSNLIQDLKETPIAPDQMLSTTDTGTYILETNIQRTYQLLNWIISLGKAATVLTPAIVRNDITGLLKQISDNYQSN